MSRIVAIDYGRKRTGTSRKRYHADYRQRIDHCTHTRVVGVYHQLRAGRTGGTYHCRLAQADE